MGDSNWTNKKVDKFVIVNNLLGEGAFGKVYRGFFANEDSKQVACKVIPIQAISDSAKYLELIKREISILQKLTHNKYIVQLYDVARTNNNLYIFLEYCQDGDLKEYIKAKNKKLAESECVLFFKHICEGFKDLNKKNIIHRDIKPANLLLHEKSIKISDFGFARSLDNTQVPGKYTRLGSPLYMAPQILEGKYFNGKCDVWSVGIVFYEMLYEATPWMAKDQTELLKNIKTKPLVFPAHIHRSEQVKDLLKGMIRVNEEERMSWDDVFKHPLLQEAKPEPVLPVENIKTTQEDLELKKMNDVYLADNLVAGYLDNRVEEVPEIQQDDKMTPSELVGQQPKESTIDREELISDASKMLQYKNEREFRKSMQRMNNFILFERNIAFVFKYTMKSVYSYFYGQKVKISDELFNKILFCLCKCQAINIEKVLSLVKEDQSSCFSDQQLWKKFKQTTEFKKTYQQIEQDKVHSMNFYQKLSQKTKQALQTEIQKDGSRKAELEKFISNINESFQMDSSFKEIYKATLKQVITLLAKEVETNANVEKETLVLLRYLIVSMNPFLQFEETDTDFNIFYEQVENSPLKDLKASVQEKLKLIK